MNLGQILIAIKAVLPPNWASALNNMDDQEL